MSSKWEMPNNEYNSHTNAGSPVEVLGKNEVATYVSKVFGWMFLALAITSIVAYYSYSVGVVEALVERFGRIAYFGMLILQLVLVGFLVMRLQKMSMTVLLATFLGYSVLNGVVFSTLFNIYESSSIVTCFGVTSLTFGVMSVVGYTTKTDLTSFGKLLMMGLIGIIIASIVNIFLESEMMYYIISYIGVAVFVGLIAYDVQKIKAYAQIEDAEMRKKASIMGAFSLYLDFINLFVYILRIFGDRK